MEKEAIIPIAKMNILSIWILFLLAGDTYHVKPVKRLYIDEFPKVGIMATPLVNFER
jgi:hypothetical protein